MKMFGKIWDVLTRIIAVYAFLYVAYVGAFVQHPTNNQLADCILYAMCVLLMRINTFQKPSEE